MKQGTRVPYEEYGLATPKGILDSSTPFTLFFSPGPNSLFQTLQPSKAKAVEQYPSLLFNGGKTRACKRLSIRMNLFSPIKLSVFVLVLL